MTYVVCSTMFANVIYMRAELNETLDSGLGATPMKMDCKLKRMKQFESRMIMRAFVRCVRTVCTLCHVTVRSRDLTDL